MAYGTTGGDTTQDDIEIYVNPIIQVGLTATSEDSFFFVENPEELYVGPYHIHQDGEIMIGAGVTEEKPAPVPPEPKPTNPPAEFNPSLGNFATNTLSPQGQWEWTGPGTTWAATGAEINILSPEEQWKWNGDEWLYNAGSISHILKPDEIIFRKVTYAAIQETREAVSDIFYKLWFESNTLTDEQLFSLQTTIRNGIKQSGRTEDEPLVFYKKDRNTLENRKDIEGDIFEQLCQYIFDNNITELEGKFSIIQKELPAEGTPPQPVIQYKIKFTDGTTSYEVNVARKVGDTFTDILNLSQLTKTKTGSKIDPEKAREVLDTDIFELLPTQPNRQEQINNLFSDFDELVGPSPSFTDVDGDGAGEQPNNYQDDEESRVSHENQVDAFVTRLDDQANEDNSGKTLQSLRNKLNTYLGDVDNVIQDLSDVRPEYENISNGFLKIRKPNQAIIIRNQNNNLLEFQKLNANGTPSYLSDGFTITMWVRFVDKQSSGTLFNFGNPNSSENPHGFRLETYIKTDTDNNKIVRLLRLVVFDAGDGVVRDNHWGSSNPKRYTLNQDNYQNGVGGNMNPATRYGKSFRIYPTIPTDDLNEWYFICATYNPNVVEYNIDDGNPLRESKEYWLNHKIYYNLTEGNRDDIVANSLEGAKCKVEIISKSDLLRARGYKVDDISVTAPPADGEDTASSVDDGDTSPQDDGGIVVDEAEDIDPLDNPSETQEETSNVEPMPIGAPNGFNPMTNPMTGTLSPQGQWSWNGVSITWVAVETEEESSEPVATNTPDDIINFGAGGGNY